MLYDTYNNVFLSASNGYIENKDDILFSTFKISFWIKLQVSAPKGTLCVTGIVFYRNKQDPLELGCGYKAHTKTEIPLKGTLFTT